MKKFILLVVVFGAVCFSSCKKEPEIIPPTEEELQLELQSAKLVGTWKMVEYHEIQTKQDGITIGREYSYDETSADFTWQFQENGLGTGHEDWPRYDDAWTPVAPAFLDYEFEWELYYDSKWEGSRFKFKNIIGKPVHSSLISAHDGDAWMLDRITDNEFDISYDSSRLLEAPAVHQVIEITFEKVEPEEQ